MSDKIVIVHERKTSKQTIKQFFFYPNKYLQSAMKITPVIGNGLKFGIMNGK